MYFEYYKQLINGNIYPKMHNSFRFIIELEYLHKKRKKVVCLV